MHITQSLCHVLLNLHDCRQLSDYTRVLLALLVCLAIIQTFYIYMLHLFPKVTLQHRLEFMREL